MAPSFDLGMLSLLCAEEAIGAVWEDEAGSKCEEAECAEEETLAIPALSTFFPVEDDEAIALLLEKEISYMPQNDYLQRFELLELDLGARENAINWILEVQAHYNFGPETAYLSINYFDRFLSSHSLMQGIDWMLQLLSVSCLSLAAKMEETEVVLPLDLQVGDLKYVFESRTIQRMELLILNTLGWRLSSVTPFSYLGYLLSKIEALGPLPSGLIARITDLILSTCKLMQFLCIRPSAIAMAAVLCACQEFLPLEEESIYREAIFAAMPVSEEATLKSYRLMKKRGWRSSRVPQSPAGVLDACLSSDSERTGVKSLESCENLHVLNHNNNNNNNNSRKRKLVA